MGKNFFYIIGILKIGTEVNEAGRLFFQAMLAKEDIELPMPLSYIDTPAFADAWASETEGGPGGWWSDSHAPLPMAIQFFHVSITVDSFPPEWQIVSLQKSIASLEMLAQAVLVHLRP
jgi:hypothetical protein